MNNPGRWLMIPCALLLLLTGCNGNSRIVDRINIVTAMGFDRAEHGYKGTAFFSEFKDTGKVHTLQGSAPQIEMIRNQIDHQSTMPIKIAKLRLLLFTQSLAEAGLSPLIHTICKDPLLSNYLTVAIFAGSLKSLSDHLEGKTNDRLPYYLLEDSVTSKGLPRSNLSTFLYDFYGEGRDISVPYIRLNQNDKVEIAGFAILKKDRLQLLINPAETLQFGILQGKPIRGYLPFDLHAGKHEGTAVFTLQYNKMSRKLLRQGSELRVVYHLSLHGMVKEYPEWLNLRDTRQMHEMLEQLALQVREHSLELIRKFQQNQVDPLGVGDLYRVHHRKWRESTFYQSEYPRITFDVQVKLHLTKSGIGE